MKSIQPLHLTEGRIAVSRVTLFHQRPRQVKGVVLGSRNRVLCHYLLRGRGFQVMNNSTWACFHCREAVRRPDYTFKDIHCPSCGEKMGYLGDRIRIPAKRQVKAWQKLWDTVHSSLNGKEWLRNWHIKRLENQIARLEASPAGTTRARKIKAYKKQLAELVN